MAKFTTITKDQMTEFLESNGFTQIHLEGVDEQVWSKIVKPNLCLRIYTTIQGNKSRSNGRDSIKLCLVSKTPDGQIHGVGKTKRVHRVEGWLNNLQNRLDLWQDLLGPQCSCGCYMVKRESRIGEFWGCSDYPHCKQIKNI